MMRRLLSLLMLLTLLLPACEPEQKQYQGHPAVEMEIADIRDKAVTLSLKTIFADEVAVLARETRLGSPSKEEVVRDGKHTSGSTLTLDGLSPERDYTAYAVALRGSEEAGELEAIAFRTASLLPDLFSWESARSGVPSFADITLVTRGQHNADAPAWTKERMQAHVSWTDLSGKEQWLFEAFLCTEGFDAERNRIFSISPSGHLSATQASWQDLLDYWFGFFLPLLDETVVETAGRIGAPPHKRYVVITIPDPILYERFTDKTSSTAYWGSLNGRRLDFRGVDDQLAAYLWFADECRQRFSDLNPHYLELAGFYILSEELVAKPSGWNYESKRWDQILPRAASALHHCREGLYWIPYYLADGIDLWKQLGIDQVWMQPNHYWDTANQHPLSRSMDAMRKYNLSMELEFEYSMVAEIMSEPGKKGPDAAGNLIFSLSDVPALRGRLREYMTAFREEGFYGKRPLALYSGTDAFHQLAVSKDPGDRNMYQEICQFITGSPLRK